MNKTEKRAKEIIAYHVKKLEDFAGSYVLSAILVGSLSNGSYTGNSGSDIDLIYILKDDAPQNAREHVLNLVEQT